MAGRGSLLWLAAAVFLTANPSVVSAQASPGERQETADPAPPLRQPQDVGVPAREADPYFDPEWLAAAARTSMEMSIDGRLDEDSWGIAVPVTNFTQRERNEGEPGTERTEVRLLFDDENLYVGIRCYDREPDKVISKGLERDDVDDGFDAIVRTLIVKVDYLLSF